MHICLFFFFQAEDGIRDYKVTGVQTCALPIFHHITGLCRATAPSQPLPALNQHHFTAPTERTPSRESPSNGVHSRLAHLPFERITKTPSASCPPPGA